MSFSATVDKPLCWLLVKPREYKEVLKMCLTKQPNRKMTKDVEDISQMRKHKWRTKHENILNLISNQGTQITVRYHFTLNWVAKIKILRTPSTGRMALKGNSHWLLVGSVNCCHLFGKEFSMMLWSRTHTYLRWPLIPVGQRLSWF